jgi:hypothetical protein
MQWWAKINQNPETNAMFGVEEKQKSGNKNKRVTRFFSFSTG